VYQTDKEYHCRTQPVGESDSEFPSDSEAATTSDSDTGGGTDTGSDSESVGLCPDQDSDSHCDSRVESFTADNVYDVVNLLFLERQAYCHNICLSDLCDRAGNAYGDFTISASWYLTAIIAGF
jgi:hypothetical protein